MKPILTVGAPLIEARGSDVVELNPAALGDFFRRFKCKADE
jgi:hypothetical protein